MTKRCFISHKRDQEECFSLPLWSPAGGFPYELTEGDIICVFSQYVYFALHHTPLLCSLLFSLTTVKETRSLLCHRYGEVVNINLVRDKKTGKSKGFCFLCYEDQRSTILAVDNFNGIKVRRDETPHG